MNQASHNRIVSFLRGITDRGQDILETFKFRNHIPTLSRSDALGTMFEELLRRFNKENNEEAGVHWTRRDVVRLMSNLIFRPIADQVNQARNHDDPCHVDGAFTGMGSDWGDSMLPYDLDQRHMSDMETVVSLFQEIHKARSFPAHEAKAWSGISMK